MSLIDFPTLNAAKKWVKKCLDGAGAIQGRSVSKLEIDSNGHLITTYDKALSDGSITQDAGEIPVGLSCVQMITTPLSTWTIQHDLNTSWDELTIIAIDNDKNFIFGEIDETNSTNNLLIINFNEPVAGKVTIKK